jgi:ATP-dependent DNA ligase
LKAAHAVQKRLDVFMWDFDLRELNGDDLRRDPLNVRKATLASVLARTRGPIR